MHSSNYDSRLYAYEPSLPYAFSLPAYSGKGIRSCLVIQYKWVPHLGISAKIGRMDYVDRGEIGSGLDLISGSHKTDISLQVVWNNL
ncbi:hypothetical protein EWU23_09585 [Cytophagaceae bacterium 50C-KIRBA]|uniref:Uncharacterized protein n=1 Tax=Aquirufa beregesia TaxID=2516556 RepID=A0ABX0F124_9BACT|nr:hypothetical protein [Aquirufa beregesia]NGZ44729.1 hypothetical protein [Aquirufa beregesia]